MSSLILADLLTASANGTPNIAVAAVPTLLVCPSNSLLNNSI